MSTTKATPKKDKIPSARQMGLDLLAFTEEHGMLPWETPWIAATPHHNPITKNVYTGTNPMRLTVEAFVHGYTTPAWVTFNQTKQAGGRIKKGAKSVMLLRAGRIVKEDEDTGEQSVIPYMKSFRVFNLEQTEGLDVTPMSDGKPCDYEVLPINERADEIVSMMPMKPRMVEAPGRAFYSPSKDTVSIPARDQFKSQEDYELVRFHELVHSTGHAKRLNREGIIEHNLFGDHLYTEEEHIAEIGAATIGQHIGLDRTKVERHSGAYLKAWLSNVSRKPEAIVTASSKAQQAVDYILRVENRYNNTK